MYKGEVQVKIYMLDLHHGLVLFQKIRNIFCYVPDNEIEGEILGWNPSDGIFTMSISAIILFRLFSANLQFHHLLALIFKK